MMGPLKFVLDLGTFSHWEAMEEMFHQFAYTLKWATSSKILYSNMRRMSKFQIILRMHKV